MAIAEEDRVEYMGQVVVSRTSEDKYVSNMQNAIDDDGDWVFSYIDFKNCRVSSITNHTDFTCF